jgi:hypothetical protein
MWWYRRLTDARVNQRMRNKIRGRRGSEFRVDLVAAIRVSLTARHALRFEAVGSLQDVMDRRTIRPKEVKEDGTLAPGGCAVDDPIHIVSHAASFFRRKPHFESKQSWRAPGHWAHHSGLCITKFMTGRSEWS